MWHFFTKKKELNLSYEEYLSIQLNSSVNDLMDAIKFEQERLTKENIEIIKKYNEKDVERIIEECNHAVLSNPQIAEHWNENTKKEFEKFLKSLPVSGYLTPEQMFLNGKRRDYRKHVENFAERVLDKNGVCFDLAGRTGWASSVLCHLGFKNVHTIELNPINVIGGRYVWGHKHVHQGDVFKLKEITELEKHGINFSNDSFVEGIFVRYALEHFYSLELFYEEMYRLLKPGGILFIIVGQSFSTDVNTGDILFFPTLDSAWINSPKWILEESWSEKNSGTKQNQFFLCLKKQIS